MQPKFRFYTTAVLLFLSTCFFSFVVAGRLAEGIWKQLGVSQQDGSDMIRQSFLDGWFHYYSAAKGAKALATGDRGAVTTDLLTYTKQYVSNPAFKAAYEKNRASYKPTEPKVVNKTKDQLRKEKIDEAQAGLQKTEASIKTMSADQQKIMKPIADMYRQNIKDYQDPNSKMIDMFYETEVAQAKREHDDYVKYQKEWETKYPADSRAFIKLRLQQYLDIAKTVDFSATVSEKNGRKVFDKPAYQSKNNDWKMIYRAGKEVYDVARPFAENWLKELQ
ncbi:MAG: hypothetical protein JST68_09165 [Bacteroidetes bacterium]|nr:hypothetical protein [Bacteroidota bacterium]